MLDNLNSFLTLGYFLDYYNKDLSIDSSNINKKKYNKIDKVELIKIGSKLWRDAISSNFKTNQKHLVPISGGLDSRAILAGLLEHTEAKNIYTYTYGTPNTLDYDIGNYIAKKFGTRHTSFDLTQYIYNQNELENISKRVNFQTVLFHHAPVAMIDQKFKGCILWSGFFGETLTGDHLPKDKSNNIEEAKKKFILQNRYVRSKQISLNSHFENLIDCNCIDKNLLTLDEQLDFQNRQTKFIAPHVLMDGFDYKLPFLHQKFTDFMLSIDNKYRYEQELYKRILLNSFPKAFSYKTKINFGLPLYASKSRKFINRVENKILKIVKIRKNIEINYLDFDEKIRHKQDLQNIMKNNILDLKERNIIDWIDIENILNNHLAKKGNYADTLIVLASLEIHLKNGLKLEGIN